MAKTVARRAAELGMEQRVLLHALRILSRRKLKRGKLRSDRRRYYWSPWYTWEPVMTDERAAAIAGVDVEDYKRECKKLEWRPWTFGQMKDAMFAFYEREGRFPMAREYKLANGLPPYRQWAARGRSELGQWSPEVGAWLVQSPSIWERLIARDRRCTAQMAIGFRNVLARKEAFDRIGFQKMVKSGFATLIDSDPEFGELYELPGETPSEPMKMLKVVNSTPEPDGTFADYWLRVPPDQTSAREAVRWTFGGDAALGQQPYEPLVQT
jgi:hypothetical protein